MQVRPLEEIRCLILSETGENAGNHSNFLDSGFVDLTSRVRAFTTSSAALQQGEIVMHEGDRLPLPRYTSVVLCKLSKQQQRAGNYSPYPTRWGNLCSSSLIG